MESSDGSTGYKILLYFGPFCLDAADRLLLENGEPLPLPGKEFDLLQLLAESGGRMKSREELIEALWPTTIVGENSLNWHIGELRKALKDKPEGRHYHYIETVHGHGYRFTAPVRVERVAMEPPGETGGSSVAADSGETGTKAATEGAGAHLLAKTTAGKSKIASKLAPTRAWTAVGIAALIVIAGVLLWRFVPFGTSGGNTAATPVIAVLPFANLSADPANAYFATGIQDTILSKLAGISELRVISRTSTKHYPSHPMNLKRVANQLGATTVLEGSVQKSGDQVLINVQLIDAKTDEHIWANVYKRSLADVFVVESDVATQVASALKAELLPAETARLTSAPTHDPQAYLLFLKANYYANQVLNSNSAKNSGAAIAQAVTLYHQAIARDSRFALAYARLSLLESYSYQHLIAHTPQAITYAGHAAKQALALKPNLPEAHLAMGYVEYYGYQNYTGALSEFEKIPEEIRNNNAETIGAIAFIHRRQGKWRETLVGLRQAAKLDPRNPRWFYDIGFTLMTLRHYAQAIQQFDRSLALEPQDYSAAAFKAIILLRAGKPLRQVRQALVDIPLNSSQSGLIFALNFEIARLSRHPEAMLTTLETAPNWVEATDAVGQEPTALLRAQGWAAQGNESQARQAYEKARKMLQAALHTQPKNSNLWSFLGLAEAGLAQKAKAIHAGLKATVLTPVSKDALAGPSHLTTLAKIYAQIAEPARAIELLRQLLTMPAGGYISVPMLERDPIWDPLRKEPAFQQLIKEYGHEAPTPTTAAGAASTAIER